MSLADAALQKLLQRGERARLSGSQRTIRESFEGTSSPYWQLGVAGRDPFHLRMRAAQSAGAVRLEWSRQGGDDRPLDAVCLVDVEALAGFLGRPTIREEVAAARELLLPWIVSRPRVAELLGAWAELKLVRSFGTSSAPAFVDSLRVLDAIERRAGEDQVLRSFSVAMFNDSKRIEDLVRHLDVLTTDELSAPARHWSEVFALLGLAKEPQPFLLAGVGEVVLTAGQRCPIVRPFVGVANHTVDGYLGAPDWVMTIENLTTFHEAAKFHARGDHSGLIVYTGGMPSPRWCRAYSMVLGSIPAAVPAYHWGDIDEGGFRIAARIRASCIAGSRAYRPWLMDRAESQVAKNADESLRKAMAAGAVRAGWTDLASTLSGVSLEQEGLPISLPGSEA